MDEEDSGVVDIPRLLAEMRERQAAAEARVCTCTLHKKRGRFVGLVAPAAAVVSLSLAANAFALVHAYGPTTSGAPMPEGPALLAKAPRLPTKPRPAAPPRPSAEIAPEHAPVRDERPQRARPRVAVASSKASAVAPSSTATMPSIAAPVGPSPAPDLESAMRLATGAPKPAETKNGADKESDARQIRPAQGAIVAALRSVQEGARGCLEADDVPRVVAVTFVATGTVSNVEASVFDAKSACIINALRVARVEPFAEASFRARITIRPK